MNLRPPDPQSGALPSCATARPHACHVPPQDTGEPSTSSLDPREVSTRQTKTCRWSVLPSDHEPKAHLHGRTTCSRPRGIHLLERSVARARNACNLFRSHEVRALTCRLTGTALRPFPQRTGLDRGRPQERDRLQQLVVRGCRSARATRCTKHRCVKGACSSTQSGSRSSRAHPGDTNRPGTRALHRTPRSCRLANRRRLVHPEWSLGVVAARAEPLRLGCWLDGRSSPHSGQDDDRSRG